MTSERSTITASSRDVREWIGRLCRGALWIVGGRATGMATVLAVYVLLARLLPAGEFGAFVLAASMAVSFSMVAMFGLSTLACRYVAESVAVEDSARAQRAMCLIARIGTVTVGVTGLAGWAAILWLSDPLFGTPKLTESAVGIALWIMLLAISQALAEVLRGLHDLRMAGLLGGISGGLVGNLLLLLGICVVSSFTTLDLHRVVLIAAGSLLFPIGVAIAYLARTWRQTAGAARKSSATLAPLTARAVAFEAIPIMLVQLFSFGLAQWDIWVVGAMGTELELAAYSVARRLSLLVAFPLLQIGLVVAPSISELHARGHRQKLEWLLRRAAAIGLAAAAVLAAVPLVAPASVLDLTFGPMFQLGASPLRIQCVGHIIVALAGPCGPALMMTGHQRMTLAALAVTLPIYMAQPLVAANAGLEAVAATYAMAIIVQNAVQWVAVRNLLGIKTHPGLPSIVSSMTCARRAYAQVVVTLRG